MELRDDYPAFDRNGLLHSRSLEHERTKLDRKAFTALEENRPRLSPQGLLTAADKRELERRLVKFGANEEQK